MEFNDLKGKTFSNIENIDNERIVFTEDSGKKYELFHSQDCCESVTVEDICGDLKDLMGSPLLVAEETTNSDSNPQNAKPETIECQDSFTWTFYKLSTIKGSVTIRWYGDSNGYYSESVDFREV